MHLFILSETQTIERKSIPLMNLMYASRRREAGTDVKLSKFINLYGCEIGDETKIGAFVEIQKNASVGKRCKISSHTFICEGVTIEDNVFIGHGVMFINDSYPRATTADGGSADRSRLESRATVVKKGASIGSGCTILSNVTIGENAIVGAGSVVTKDVPREQHRGGKSGEGFCVISNQNRGGHKVSNSDSQSAFLFLIWLLRTWNSKQELTAVFRQASAHCRLHRRPDGRGFEKAFATFCEASHAVGVSSGTDALRFALMAAACNPATSS